MIELILKLANQVLELAVLFQGELQLLFEFSDPSLEINVLTNQRIILFVHLVDLFSKLVYLFLVELFEVLQLSILTLQIDVLGVDLIHIICHNLILLVSLFKQLNLLRELFL